MVVVASRTAAAAPKPPAVRSQVRVLSSFRSMIGKSGMISPDASRSSRFFVWRRIPIRMKIRPMKKKIGRMMYVMIPRYGCPASPTAS